MSIMIDREPTISVGIIEHAPEASGTLNGVFEVPTTVRLKGGFSVRNLNGKCILYDDEGIEVMKGEEIRCRPLRGGSFTLRGVTIGIKFHWERKEDQTFEGVLRFVAEPGGAITVVNEISVEEYL